MALLLSRIWPRRVASLMSPSNSNFPFSTRFRSITMNAGIESPVAYQMNMFIPLVSVSSNIFSEWIMWIKRTFQPSIIRKRRKHGFLERQRSVGGRRVLKRRMAKGRARLGGS